MSAIEALSSSGISTEAASNDSSERLTADTERSTNCSSITQDSADAQAYASQIQQKYEEERAKRLRPDGSSQYIELSRTDEFQTFRDDPWVDSNEDEVNFDGSHFKFLIIGAGYGGILLAVRLIEAGIPASDIRLVDTAGGFGGTWYWNRYPGLMCDVESYIYMPLLEEMGYVPKNKYAYGPELRTHANAIADKWGFKGQAMFRHKVENMNWDDEAKEWIVKMINIARGRGGKEVTVRSDFVLMSPGILHSPKLPAVPGIESFQGLTFHTSRWDYGSTGGSPTDPFLTKLQEKSVGVIGTGATAVQLVPVVAKWAKQLYVFQRTPSSVNRRDNRPTNPEEWRKNVATKTGWWRERNENYNACLAQSLPPNTTNLVDDEWTRMPSYFGLIGSPRTVNPAEAPAFAAELYTRDIPYAEKVRARVSEIVKDEETAKNLKHWYPTWCKRPTFHDEYLQAFNQPNVKLVHTDGKSISNITPQGVVFADKEYPVDVLIFATGYELPSKRSNPASRAGIDVIGRSGRSIAQKFAEKGDTLHGVITRDFPNLLWTGASQAGISANFVFTLDVLARHIAYIIATGLRGNGDEKIVIEPTAEAEDQWGSRVASMAVAGSAIIGCTPGYLNAEGMADMIRHLPPEDRMKAARKGIWMKGVADYVAVIEDWRKDGKLDGLVVTSA